MRGSGGPLWQGINSPPGGVGQTPRSLRRRTAVPIGPSLEQTLVPIRTLS